MAAQRDLFEIRAPREMIDDLGLVIMCVTGHSLTSRWPSGRMKSGCAIKRRHTWPRSRSSLGVVWLRLASFRP